MGRKIKGGEGGRGVPGEYSPLPRKLREANRKIRSVSLYRRGIDGKGEAAWGATRRQAALYIRATVFSEKVFKEKLRSDRNVSFAEMDGAPAVGSVFVPSIVALYLLCQLQVG